MRHATRSQRLSRPTAHRDAVLTNLVKALIAHGSIQTTYARAKETQRLADRLVTFGKDGSLHARRLAFRILQDRTLVKRLFSEIAPTFVQTNGGYTRVVRLAMRRGDGAQTALLAFSRLSAAKTAPGARAASSATRPGPGPATPPRAPEQAKSKEPRKGFFEGLRTWWLPKKKKGSAVS